MLTPTMWSDLLQEFDQLRRDVDQAVASTPTTWQRGSPAVNVFSTDDTVMLTAEIPGIDPDALEISAWRDTLTIKGERQTADTDDDARWQRRERGSGSFTRTLKLPYRIDADSVHAKAKDGVLAIIVKRPEADRPQRITVNAAS